MSVSSSTQDCSTSQRHKDQPFPELVRQQHSLSYHVFVANWPFLLNAESMTEDERKKAAKKAKKAELRAAEEAKKAEAAKGEIHYAHA